MHSISQKTVIFLITFYQVVISGILKQLLGVSRFCPQNPTCSDYAKQAIVKHGIIRGTIFAAKRILNCRPGVVSASL